VSATCSSSDFDTIEAANLSRSVLFRSEDNGEKKALIAARRVKELNPDVHVQYFHGDVNTALGLGVFRRMDAIIGCLDNREARLSINRFAYRLNKAWVDGAIQELWGLVRVFVPGQGACYECTLTEQARREMSLRYSCPLLARQNILLGKVPTTPTISSIVGGMQSQEALKLIHNMAGQCRSGHAYQWLDERFSHDRLCAGRKLREPLDLRRHYRIAGLQGCDDNGRGTPADRARTTGGKRRDRTRSRNRPLNSSVIAAKPLSMFSSQFPRSVTTTAWCPGCGELREVHMAHAITGDEPFIKPLAACDRRSPTAYCASAER